METEVAGGEIELLVVAGVVGDMHLTVFASYRSVAVEDYGCVVVQTGGTLLEERCHQDDAVVARCRTIEIGRRTGNRFAEVELVNILCLTEIYCVVKLLEHNEIRAVGSELVDFFAEPRFVVGYVRCIVLLDDSYLHFSLFLLLFAKLRLLFLFLHAAWEGIS